jgi:hypothetical protein
MAGLLRKGRFVIGSVSAAVVLLTISATMIVVTGIAASAALATNAFIPGDCCDVVAVDDNQTGSRCSHGWYPRAPAWELHPSSSPKG